MSASPVEFRAGSGVSDVRRRRSAAAREAGSGARRVPAVGATFFVGLIVLLSAYIPNEGGPAPVDVVLLAACAFAGLLLGTSAGNPMLERALVRIGVAVWAYATLATIWTVFFSGDSLRLLIDVFSMLYLVTPLLLLRQHPTGPRAAVFRAVGVTSLLASAAILLLGSGERASGSLANPNMAGTWVGAALVLILTTMHRGRWTFPLLAVPLLVAAVFMTQSYSAFLGITVSVAYFTIVSTPRNAIRIPSLAALGVLLLSWQSLIAALPAGDRLERSSGSRQSIWTDALDAWLDHPFGIGYGNFVDDKLVDGGMMTHNDYLAALVEMGVVGLAALLALFATIWWVGRRATRAVLLFVMVSAFTHNVLNFRHLWVFLAIALAYDLACSNNEGQAQEMRKGAPHEDYEHRGAATGSAGDPLRDRSRRRPPQRPVLPGLRDSPRRRPGSTAHPMGP